jgi:hypothetical protein
MIEIKFKCPSCGQPIQCPPGHAGENIPCPGCATLIRVPPAGELAESPVPPSNDSPFPPADGSEKVSYVPIEQLTDAKTSTHPATSGSSREKSTPSDSRDSAINPSPSPAGADAHSMELRCTCPVCQAQLRISITAESTSHEASETANNSGPEHLSMKDRERQIEAARKAHAAQPAHPTIKPRLDKILDGSTSGT